MVINRMDSTSPILQDTPTQWFLNDWRILLAVLLIIVAIIGLYIYYYGKDEGGVREERVRPPVSVAPVREQERQTWCLVAEDLAGRYCVKVPGPQSCTHERSYLSEEQCTLTPGMHLPAGVNKNQNTSISLLSQHKS